MQNIRQDGWHRRRSAVCLQDQVTVQNALASFSNSLDDLQNKLNIWYLGQVEVVQEVHELGVAWWTEVGAGFLLQRQPHRVLVGKRRCGCIMDAPAHDDSLKQM